MKSITIRLPDEEHATVVKVALLRGISIEELALDHLRLGVESDLEARVGQILDLGMEHEPQVAEAVA